MTETNAVGVDLGTTYSAAAQIDRSGHSKMIRNDEGEVLTPSVVLFADDEIVVGTDAKKAGVLQPDRYAECAKRDMGSPTFSKRIAGFHLPPEVIQAFVLKKLRSDIVHAVGHHYKVVITVPAFFDEPRRRATATAAFIADLDVLDIINEPTAGALAVGEHLGLLDDDDSDGKTVLVFDLGGGTFDATLLEMGARNFRTIATDGDVRLGGLDWDSRLVDLVSERFIRQYREDPRANATNRLRLEREAEFGKRTLSVRKQARVRVDHAGVSAEIEVSREEFQDATRDLLERTAYTGKQLLKVANVEPYELAEIFLVGGASRMPMVSEMLEKEFGRKPIAIVNPDEANARGAALYARYRLQGKFGNGTKPVAITNVNAHSLGIEGIERDTERNVNAILIPKNTPLPARVTQEFATKRVNQPSVAVRVLEGESAVPSENTLIGNAVVRNLPRRLEKGHPINITYEYSVSGRLQVWAKVRNTDCAATIQLERITALPEQMFDRWRSAVTSPYPNVEELRTIATESVANDAIVGEWVITNESEQFADRQIRNEIKEDRAETGRDEDAVQGGAEFEQVDEFQTQFEDDIESGDQATAETILADTALRRRHRSSSFGFALGHVVFSFLGIAVGYYLIHRIDAERFPLPQLVKAWVPWLP